MPADLHATRPFFDEADSVRLAQNHYGLEVSASPLDSERDRNFLLTDGGGERFVLKVASADEERSALELQHAMMARLAALDSRFSFPEVIPSLGGSPIVDVDAQDGRNHQLRLLSWVQGATLASARPHTNALRQGLGELLGAVAAGLDGFAHPGANRPLLWDARHGSAVVRDRLEAIAEPDRRKTLECALEKIDRALAPLTSNLRTSVLHNDANDHNVLVGPCHRADPGCPAAERQIAGLVDFGDAVEGWTILELAIGVAYAVLGSADPLAAAAPIVAGYHARFPAPEGELEAIFPLVCLRLAMSVAISAEQRAREPENEYLSISEAGAWEALLRLRDVDPAFAHFTFRGACGLEPCPTARAVRGWLRDHQAEMAPIVGPELDPETLLVLDLGVGSPLFGAGAPGSFDAETQSRAIFGAIEAAGAAVGYGRYDESRCWYGGELFGAPSDEAPRLRTVHVGVDLFLPAGAAVFSPLAGKVHSLRDNAGELDYGPTIVLEHELPSDDGETGPLRLYSLYGHLSRESLEDLAPGTEVAAGSRIAELGDESVNGGWAPHLHFQLMLDLLGREGDFPGVVAPGERSTWLSLCPDPNLILGLPSEALERSEPGREAILETRRSHLGPSLSLAYHQPLHIVRGFRQWLYDADGQPYLDAVNNVPHVGHSHPRVVEAASLQTSVLNTNTRYLHEKLALYVERLSALLPESLEVCFLVCSGSEANELALRLARAHTGRRDVVTVEGAYHGNTSALVDLSPYKHDGPGGSGAPDWVHTVPMPDAYRARMAADPEAGMRLAAHVGDACSRAEPHGGAAAFFCEPLLGCGGQVVPSPGYLSEAFRLARQAGAVAVADEVQIGFGRVGTHLWAFEAQGAIPDVVTLGKPIGNGFPLAALVTTREIADSFANGMEYFNTFGGNPVACAVGLAVLDVIEEEGLQENARLVGEHLLSGLRELADRHPLIGDVRGTGLYVGVELVRDRDTLEPAAAEAGYVVNRMKDHGILIGIDGPLHNVLKIKPPLVFETADTDRLVDVLDRVLSEDYLRPRS